MAARTKTPKALPPYMTTFEACVQRDLADEIQADAERAGQTISEWITAAARRHLEDAGDRTVLREYRERAGRQALEEYEAEFGAISDEEMAELTREWRD